VQQLSAGATVRLLDEAAEGGGNQRGEGKSEAKSGSAL
jgi:hypothetical protein